MILSSDEDVRCIVATTSPTSPNVGDVVATIHLPKLQHNHVRTTLHVHHHQYIHLDAIQHKSGNKRKRRAPEQSSFDDRFNDLMAFTTKYGHCNVSHTGEDASLGQWCSVVRGLYKKIQNNQQNNQMN